MIKLTDSEFIYLKAKALAHDQVDDILKSDLDCSEALSKISIAIYGRDITKEEDNDPLDIELNSEI